MNNLQIAKKVYPDGRVPKDFKNWLLKIKSNYLKEESVKNKRVQYVESFPFRKGVSYKYRSVEVLDVNLNVIYLNKIIRITE
jgi:hypothetical protein